MAQYLVRAGTSEGRVIFRTSRPPKEEAGRLIEKDGLYPLDIEVRIPKASSMGLSFLNGRPRVKSGDLLVFNQGLLTLLKAGLPVIDSLETLQSSSGASCLSEVIADTVSSIRNGQSLSEAMTGHPEVFPYLYTSAIGAGERTGDLIPSIRVSGIPEDDGGVRKKVVSALIYPVVLGGASILVVAFLLTYVVPTFAMIYLDAGSELPFATMLLVRAIGFLKTHFILFGLLILTAIIAARVVLRDRSNAAYFDSIKLRVPVFGDIYRGYAVSKFSRTFGMILASGMPVITAIEMSKTVLNNSVLEAKIDLVIKKVSEGSTIAKALAEAAILPEITMRMFSVGEKSASLPAILVDISDFHDAEITHRIGILTDLIEPALMVIMGIVIGTIVVLMYLPIFQLGSRSDMINGNYR